MPATANLKARVRDLRAVELENDWLRVTILPDVGAKIYDLVWKPTGKNFLWHNPRIAPQTYPVEGNFDNYWCGGWDDAFPTCDACEYRGEQFPNLGELRSVRWNVELARSEGGSAETRLVAYGPISPVKAEKSVLLDADSPLLRMRYEITNLGPLPLEFIWGTHPALHPDSDTILHVPARTGIVGQASHPRLGTPGERYSWPGLETPYGRTDMSRVQAAEAGIYCGHYTTDFQEGWYSVENTQTGEGFLLRFPLEVCPYLWMWLVYGGWRGYYHIILEPWTSYPVNLAEAVRNGSARRLGPGEKFTVEVRATVYTSPETWKEALARVG